jgi:mycofactocin precursor
VRRIRRRLRPGANDTAAKTVCYASDLADADRNVPDPVAFALARQRGKERPMSELQVLEPIELESETTEQPPADEVLDDDLLVEEISIDGMCGVY